ncbi:cation-chloride cotransporter 1-like [Thraustotheca clavata]|uniref:Cation-chloride cotransporter 1-like n=1 Tax=Thraustotheca clavata TaxID=74557 RepID=A0A1W0A790_9STRA|nr:cation-chloride cotransporter 1-like [Thraustotheca clavata]
MEKEDDSLLSETRAAELVCDITSNDGLFDEISRESCTMTLSKCSGDVELTLPPNSPKAQLKKSKQGTVHGVFLPCLQAMITVVLFLRMPWVTGQAGVPLTCFLFVMCQSVGYLTVLSICALVTNGKIAGGGVYYLISRTIGIETGLSIGLLVACGSSFSIAFMALGAIETLHNIFDTSHWIISDVGSQAIVLLLCLGSVAAVGMKYISMVGFGCFVAVMIAIACSFLGLLLQMSKPETSTTPVIWFDNIQTNYAQDPTTGIMPTLTTMISVVYPGTTGYMAGAMRSGVLANPGRSIPTGTLYAMITVLAINLACVIAFGSTIPNAVLKSDKFIMSTVAWPNKQIINVGIFFSAVGGALQSLAGTPRMLAAMANDNVIAFLKPFMAKDSDEPRRAIAMILTISCGACISGNLDFLAPFLTLSSLMLCATLNFACFSMAFVNAPGFRPKWRYFHWITALLGSIWSIGLMVFFSWSKALCAIALCLILRIYVRCIGFKKNWGSSIRGMHLELACWLLKYLNQTDDEEHTKNWRPQILVFCKTNTKGEPSCPRLLDFTNQLKEGHGLIEVVSLLAGKDDATYDLAQDITLQLRTHLINAHISGFGHVYACKSVLKSIGTVAEASGMGPLRSNTIVLGWPKDLTKPDFVEEYVDMLHEVINCKKSLLLVKGIDSYPSNDEVRRGTIDIWWVLHDGGLLLLIPYLLHRHSVWRKCKLRLFSVISITEDADQIQAKLVGFLEEARIEAEVHVVALRKATISALAIKRTKDELIKKRNLLSSMKISTLSFTVRDRYEQITDDLNDIGSPVHEEDNGSKYEFSNITDTRLIHANLLNQHILASSSEASLIVVNLPRLIGVPSSNFIQYVEALTQTLPSVLLVRGSGREFSTDASYSFVKSRRAYQAEVSELRKLYMKQELARREKLAQDQAAERERIMKAKAARLELKRQKQAIRAEEVAAEKARHAEFVAKRAAEKKLVREEGEQKIALKRENILAALKSESANWIDEDSIKKHLSEEVFVFSPPKTESNKDNSRGSVGALSWLERLKSMKPADLEQDDKTKKD